MFPYLLARDLMCALGLILHCTAGVKVNRASDFPSQYIQLGCGKPLYICQWDLPRPIASDLLPKFIQTSDLHCAATVSEGADTV